MLAAPEAIALHNDARLETRIVPQTGKPFDFERRKRAGQYGPTLPAHLGSDGGPIELRDPVVKPMASRRRTFPRKAIAHRALASRAINVFLRPTPQR